MGEQAHAALLAACGTGDAPPVDPGAGPDVTGAWEYDVAENHRYADLWSELSEIESGTLEHRPCFTRGWSMPNLGKDDPDRLWSDAREAVLTFWLAEVAERSVSFSAHAFMAAHGAETMGSVELNGESLTTFLVGGDQTIGLPAAHQREGLNELRFSFSAAGRPGDYIEGNRDHRLLSANFSSFAFEIADGGVAGRAERAAELLAEGASHEVRTGRRGVVKQTSAATIRHHVRLPAGATLRAGVFYEEGDAEMARFRVLGLRDGEDEQVLGEVVVPPGELGDLDVSLGGLADSIVRLTLEVAAADDAGAPVRGTWVGPVIVSDESPAPLVGSSVPAEERLAAAREALKNGHVVAILLDALNPSYLSCYGGREGVTPHLDRMAAEGALFTSAYAQASFTISSVASVLTSNYTWRHGAWFHKDKVVESVFSWPEHFRENGYKTVGIVHSPNGSSIHGFERGFESYREVFREVRESEGRQIPLATDVLPPLEQELAERDDRPLFLWLHIIEPHEPYTPPEPFADMFDADFDGDLTADDGTRWSIRERRFAPGVRELPKERALQHIVAEYEANLHYVDTVVEDVRARLEQAGILENAVLAIFSDHGEAFLEHEGKIFAEMGHGSTVYDDMVRIPLIVRLPDGLAPAGVRPDAIVGGIDLLPTFADLVGVPAPDDGTSLGTSFAPMLFDEEARVRELLLSHTSSLASGRRFLPSLGIWTDRSKYIYMSGEPHELFDRGTDRGEQRSVAEERPVEAGWLRQLMRRESRFDLDRGLIVEALGYGGDGDD